MARKCKQYKTAGFYKEFHEDEELVGDAEEFLTGNGAQDSIYEVERLVEKRIKKVGTVATLEMVNDCTHTGS